MLEAVVKDFISQVQDYLIHGNYPDAKIIAEKLLSENDKDAKALCILGICSLQEGDIVNAQMVLETSIRIDPDDPDTHLAIAQVFFMKDQFRLSELHLILCLSLDSNHLGASFALSQLYYSMGKYQESLSWFNLTKSLSPSIAHVYIEAFEAMHQGRLLNAYTLLDRVLGELSFPDTSRVPIPIFPVYQHIKLLEEQFRLVHGCTISSVLTMEKAVADFLEIDPDEVLQVAKEAELLLLMGAKVSPDAFYVLQSLDLELRGEELWCYMYAGFLLMGSMGDTKYNDPAMIKAFSLAISNTQNRERL